MALSRKGFMRVVWERYPNYYVPFLDMTRSLGDFWSYSQRTQQFTVSPVPDVVAHPVDLSTQKFVVVASDGLWKVMTPTEVVEFVDDYTSRHCMNKPNDVASALLHEALDWWKIKRHRADNIAILIAFLSGESCTSCVVASSDRKKERKEDTALTTPTGTSYTRHLMHQYGLLTQYIDQLTQQIDAATHHSLTPVLPGGAQYAASHGPTISPTAATSDAVVPQFSMFGTENGQKRKLSSDEDPILKRPRYTDLPTVVSRTHT